PSLEDVRAGRVSWASEGCQPPQAGRGGPGGPAAPASPCGPAGPVGPEHSRRMAAVTAATKGGSQRVPSACPRRGAAALPRAQTAHREPPCCAEDAKQCTFCASRAAAVQRCGEPTPVDPSALRKAFARAKTCWPSDGDEPAIFAVNPSRADSTSMST